MTNCRKSSIMCRAICPVQRDKYNFVTVRADAAFVHRMPSQFKDSREKCWGARDVYWQCLDSNNEEKEKCVKFRKEYEKLCTQQWVKHFDRKRKYERFKATADLNNWESLPKQK